MPFEIWLALMLLLIRHLAFRPERLLAVFAASVVIWIAGHQILFLAETPVEVSVVVGPTLVRMADVVNLQPGDVVVCLGAGNITAWAHALPGQIQQLAAEKAGPRAIANDSGPHGGSAA